MSRSRLLEDNNANANANAGPHSVLPPPGTVPGDDGTFMHPRLPRTPIRSAPALISEENSALGARIRLRHAPAVSSSLVSLAWPRVAAETAAVPLNRAAEASLIHPRIIRLMRYSTPALRLNSGPSTFATHRLVGDRCGFARAGRGSDCCKSCMHARVRRLALISPTFLARSSHTHTNRFLGRNEDNDTFAFEIIRVPRRPCRRLLRRPRHRRRQQCRSSHW